MKLGIILKEFFSTEVLSTSSLGVSGYVRSSQYNDDLAGVGICCCNSAQSSLVTIMVAPPH